MIGKKWQNQKVSNLEDQILNTIYQKSKLKVYTKYQISETISGAFRYFKVLLILITSTFIHTIIVYTKTFKRL